MLDNGAQLPAITARDLEGNDLALADMTAGSWSVVVFYRGHW
jgi:peroxiredoxin